MLIMNFLFKKLPYWKFSQINACLLLKLVGSKFLVSQKFIIFNLWVLRHHNTYCVIILHHLCWLLRVRFVLLPSIIIQVLIDL